MSRLKGEPFLYVTHVINKTIELGPDAISTKIFTNSNSAFESLIDVLKPFTKPEWNDPIIQILKYQIEVYSDLVRNNGDYFDLLSMIENLNQNELLKNILYLEVLEIKEKH